jgi:hypothetical protein
MGCSVNDLLRWLPQALGDLHPYADVVLDGQQRLVADNILIRITGSSRPGRQIALLQIPILDVDLIFAKTLTASQIEGALKRFDLYTRRGGG